MTFFYRVHIPDVWKTDMSRKKILQYWHETKGKQPTTGIELICENNYASKGFIHFKNMP